MVSFSIVLSIKAQSEFKKLPLELQVRIKKKLKDSMENPFRHFERLKSRVDYKLRVGDYRIIADIINSSKQIEITKIGHRKNVYKNLD